MSVQYPYKIKDTREGTLCFAKDRQHAVAAMVFFRKLGCDLVRIKDRTIGEKGSYLFQPEMLYIKEDEWVKLLHIVAKLAQGEFSEHDVKLTTHAEAILSEKEEELRDMAKKLVAKTKTKPAKQRIEEDEEIEEVEEEETEEEETEEDEDEDSDDEDEDEKPAKKAKTDKKAKKGGTIVAFVMNLLTQKPDAETSEIIDRVQARFPDSAICKAHVGWYRAKARKEGILPPTESKSPKALKKAKKASRDDD